MPAGPHAADLAVGDTIHPDRPPHCCRTPMRYYGVADLSTWECRHCSRAIGTNAAGVIDNVNECALCGAPGAVYRSPINNAPYCNEACDAADNPDE